MGGGKTLLMRGIVSGLEPIYGQLKVLVVVPFTNLREQVRETFAELNIPVTVETYQEALCRGVRHFDLLFLDEAHHVPSETWRKVPYVARAKAIIGLTGTPFRIDREPLLSKNGGIFSTIINGPSMEELTAQNYLAKLKYYAYPLKKITKQIPVGKYMTVGWKEETVYEIDNKEPDIVKEYQENFVGKSAIIFCKNYQHSVDITNKFIAAGLKADYLSCYRKHWENENARQNMLEGSLKILCAVNMGSEGLNIPRLKTVLMAREIKNSATLYLQQIFRALRWHEGEEATALDLVGNVYRFNRPEQLLKEKVIV